MNVSILKDAGLTEGEIKVYLALLEIGSTTSGPIIKKSGISRSIIYTILEKLMNKGLVSYLTKEKTKYFQAAQPNKLLEYIEEKEEKIRQSKGEIEKILPILIKKQESAKQSEVQLYQGLKGVRTAYEYVYSRFIRNLQKRNR